MWWSRSLAVVAVAALLAGCGFRPLYGTGGENQQVATYFDGENFQASQRFATAFPEEGWTLAGGPCPLCEGIKARVDAAGGSIPLDEPFAVAGEKINGQKVPWTVMHKPAHPRCRCRNKGFNSELDG